MQEMIVILGLLLGTATVMAMLLRLLKQSSIIAFICTGMLAGLFREQVQLPPEVLDFFIEVGIILLLFMAGLELDIKSFLKRWRLVVINGLGQVIFLTALGLMLGYFYIGITQMATLIFFALCLTLSSTIIVLGTLKEKRAMESLHGQIVLGLMVIQDIIAVLALSFIKNIGDDSPLLVVVSLMFLKMGVLIVVLTLLSKFVLRHLFHFFARSSEMLFIGSLGYCMGVAGLCEFFHFSPEIGAFFAGASLAFLPYKLEIEDKVEPLKAFGIILFFITLGFNLQFKAEMLDSLVQVAVLALFVVFGTPLIMMLLGWMTRLKARPAFLIGGIINQISEFSLILATLCHRAGVFNDSVFTLITLTCLATFVLSSLGHQYLDVLYTLSKRSLSFIDRSSIPYQVKSLTDFEFEDHVVILSFNEIAHDLMEFYSELGEKVLLIDLDPEIHQHFQTDKNHNAVPLYADMYDPDVWKEFNFNKAKIVISCMVRGQEAEIAIARWIKARNPKVLFVATTDSQEEALELYDSGVDYVIQTEFLAAEIFREIFTRELAKGEDAFKELAQSHQKKIREQQQKLEPIFRLL